MFDGARYYDCEHSDAESEGNAMESDQQDDDALPHGSSERLREIWKNANPDFRKRLKAALLFADDHSKAIEVQAMYELLGFSESEATTVSEKLCPDLPSTKTRKRWLRKLMYLFKGEERVRKVTLRYRHSALGRDSQYINGFFNDLKGLVSSLLEDVRFSDMNSMFIGEVARDEFLDYNKLPFGEAKLAGEPMTASFARI
jgi:hypothetical protein